MQMSILNLAALVAAGGDPLLFIFHIGEINLLYFAGMFLLNMR